VIAGSPIAEGAPIVLLPVLFSARAEGVMAPILLLAAFLGFVIAVVFVIVGVERTGRLTRKLLALQETTAEYVRDAVALLMIFASLATWFGLEAIPGAFLAGAILKTLDRDQAGTRALLYVS
jgi:Kef-type K+ transport system membrane component KefB